MTQLQDATDYKAPKYLLKDRVIMVTGSGDGIGKVLARACARFGATVVLLGRTQKKLEQTYDEIIESNGQRPAIFVMDLKSKNPSEYQGLATAIDDEYGRLDGLVLNAGILGDFSPIEHYEPAVWEQVMTVNVQSYFLMTQAMLPMLKKSSDASIIYTSSTVGRMGRAYWGAYSVSKFATEGLMQVVADEVDGNTKIRSNSVNPGATRTSMRAQAYPGEDPETLPTAEALLPTYLYLLGPDSIGVNGAAFNAQKKK